MHGSRNFCQWRKRFVLCPIPHSALAGGFGSPGFAGEAGSSQSTSNVLSAVTFEDALSSRVGSSLPSGALVPGGERGFVVVDGEGPSSQGGSIWDTRSRSTPVLGHVSVGVGRTPPRSGSVWGVVGAGELLHISLLEMKALFLALLSFQELVAGCRVTAMCDNSTVVAYVNKQGRMISRSLCLLASQLLRWSESLDVHLDVRYLPGQSSVLADLLSRRDQVIGTEWSLYPRVARDLLRHWGSPSIDLFVTSLNAKLPLYCSPVPDPQAVFEDSFSSSLGQPGPVSVSTLSSGRKGGGSSQRDPQSLHDFDRPPSGQRRSGSQTFSFY